MGMLRRFGQIEHRREAGVAAAEQIHPLVARAGAEQGGEPPLHLRPRAWIELPGKPGRIEPAQLQQLRVEGGLERPHADMAAVRAAIGLVVLHGGVWWGGQSVHGRSPLDLVARGIVHVMEGRRVLRHLSVEQNLVIGGHAAPNRGELKRRLEEVCDTVPILGRLYRRTAGLLSGGEQQLLVIGRAMMARPRLLLIDEPSLGLAPKTVDQVFELLDMLRKRGMGIVLVEQNARVALQVADDACVLENGRVAIGGSAQDLRENDDVKAFYMGLHASGERRRLLETVATRRRRDFGRVLARSERHEEKRAVA